MIDKLEEFAGDDRHQKRCARPALALLESTPASAVRDADAPVLQALSTVAILETMRGSASRRLGVRATTRAIH